MILKCKKGFTLVELVVAIAALALCSGIIMSMYLTGDELSKDALLYDDAVIWSSNIAEFFKESESVDSFIENIHFDTADSEDYSWILYLDEQWYEVENKEAAAIIIYLEVSEYKQYSSGKLYKLKINIKEAVENKENAILELIAKKYYPGGAS